MHELSIVQSLIDAVLDFALTDMFLLCPCGSADVHVVTGRELQLVSVEVA